jgi:serine/threonine protein kinase
MDLKPSNVVIDADSNAVLLDVSGIGGTTQEWLAPEMRHLSNPLAEDIESKKKNDIWALGKLLFQIANACGRLEKAELGSIASAASTTDPSLRTSLEHITIQLSSAITTVSAPA